MNRSSPDRTSKVVTMSLRHALLGLLSEQPQSGWDLSRRFTETLGAVWPAGHPQIYGELRKLLADELITVHETGPRGRVVYAVTDAGRAEVTRWLSDEAVDHTMRLEPILRSVFFWLLPPDTLRAHLDAEVAYYRETADQYRRLTEAKDRGDFGTSEQTHFLRIAAEAGVRINEALADWAAWARDLTPAARRVPARPAGRRRRDRG
jgi:DNA-binding PadR family transcriptional regulator